MQTREAETIAIAALSFIANDQTLLSRFVAVTGIEAGAIRQAAATPGFLAGVLNFITAHDPTVIDFSNFSDIAAEQIAAAAETLANDTGPDVPTVPS